MFPPSFQRSHSRSTSEPIPNSTSAPSSLSSVGHAPALSSRNPELSCVALRDAVENDNVPMFRRVPPHPMTEGADHSMAPAAEFWSVAPFRIPTSPSSPDTCSGGQIRVHGSGLFYRRKKNANISYRGPLLLAMKEPRDRVLSRRDFMVASLSALTCASKCVCIHWQTSVFSATRGARMVTRHPHKTSVEKHVDHADRTCARVELITVPAPTRYPPAI